MNSQKSTQESDTGARWRLVTITTSVEAAEIVSSLLFELGSTGIITLEEGDDWLTLGAYFAQNAPVANLEDRIRLSLPVGYAESMTNFAISEIRDEDWMQKWKEGFEAVHIGRQLVVAPSWKLPEKREAQIVIQIDPGMAFGTGTHETTRLCLEALELHWRGGSMLDVGTGTGILAIAAALMHPSARVVGIDVDPHAVAVARENAAINGVSGIELLEGQPRDLNGQQFNLVAANLTAEVIVDLTDDLSGCVEANGLMILSGILHDLSQDVVCSLEGASFSIIERYVAGEWIALVAVKT